MQTLRKHCTNTAQKNTNTERKVAEKSGESEANRSKAIQSDAKRCDIEGFVPPTGAAVTCGAVEQAVLLVMRCLLLIPLLLLLFPLLLLPLLLMVLSLPQSLMPLLEGMLLLLLPLSR
jgi:hypothetical protein